MIPKIKFFYFGIDQKLAHHSSVEFHVDSYGDGFKAYQLYLRPQLTLIDLNRIITPKLTIFNPVRNLKMDKLSSIEFGGE